jgi:hypothetical protein
VTGKVAVSTRPNWANHDNEIIIAAGGAMNTLSAAGLGTLDGSPPTGVKWLGVLDSYLIVAGYDRTEWRWSDVGNHDSWTATNITNVDDKGQSIRQLQILRERIHLFKDHEIEIWDSVGGATIFNRSFVVNKGTLASDSVIQANDTIYWFGDDGDFYMLNGVNPQVISQSYSDELRELTTTSDMYALDFRAERSIRWFAPTHGRCFVYDYGKGAFTEDNIWDNAQFERLPIASYMELEPTQKRYVGDYDPTGKIYEWSTEHKTDKAGQPIRVYRKYQVMLTETGNQGRINRVQFRIKRGVANDDEPTPLFTFRYRLDQGQYAKTRNYDLGAKGKRDPYIEIYNLGVAREMEMEVVETDATEFLLTNVALTVRDLGR